MVLLDGNLVQCSMCAIKLDQFDFFDHSHFFEQVHLASAEDRTDRELGIITLAKSTDRFTN